MKVFLPSALIASAILFGSYDYTGSTTAVVTLVGAHIKALDNPVNTKYPRKDCPVCEGNGWYWSGDGIKKVDCGYCELDKEKATEQSVTPIDNKTKVFKK